ncbi:MAG TPA: superoxide dismutase family protein [Pyrinomonadaceae bacterium]|nr:superoxide dismutase family protein [Pyrinomonadaceae bacterium]
MRLTMKLTVAFLFVACLAGLRWEEPVRADRAVKPSNTNPVRARAIVNGPNGIHGEVLFLQGPCPGCPTPAPGAPAEHFRNFPEPGVWIVARISGPTSALTPGAHGMHIHEVGVCEAPGFTTAGSHLDLGPAGSNLPVDANHPYHTGDIPNLIVSSQGNGFLSHISSRITLSPGPLSIFDANGSAVIVHLNPDRGETGVTSASGGPRIACGVIQLVPDDDDDFNIGR